MNDDQEARTWLCPNCGEAVEESFDACWNCRRERPGIMRSGSDSEQDGIGDEAQPPCNSGPTRTGSKKLSAKRPGKKPKPIESALHRLPKRDALTEQAIVLLESYLEPGESLMHWARAQRVPGPLLTTFLILPPIAWTPFALLLVPIIINSEGGHRINPILLGWVLMLPILPFALLWVAMAKHYVVGLTNRRLIIIQFRGRLSAPRIPAEHFYSLDHLPPVEVGKFMMAVRIRILNPEGRISLDFPRIGLLDNQAQATAIGKLLSRGKFQTTAGEIK